MTVDIKQIADELQQSSANMDEMIANARAKILELCKDGGWEDALYLISELADRNFDLKPFVILDLMNPQSLKYQMFNDKHQEYPGVNSLFSSLEYRTHLFVDQDPDTSLPLLGEAFTAHHEQGGSDS